MSRRWLAIDYGEKRIGLAVSDESGTAVTPLPHLERRAGKRPPVSALIEAGVAHGVSAYVLGLPLDGEGDETPRSQEVRDIARRIAERTGVPTHLVDERFTTAAALRTVRDLGGSVRGRKGDLDSLAATILLQHALTLSL